jgi:hypothetical protein
LRRAWREGQPGAHIFPIAVKHVTGDDHELDFLADRIPDEVVEAGSGRTSNLIHGIPS